MDWSYNLRLFKEIFFPRACAVCAKAIDEGLVCEACRRHYALSRTDIWGANQDSWQELSADDRPLAPEEIFDRRELLYRYDGAFQEALHRVKFEGRRELLHLLREEAHIALSASLQRLARHYDMAICIPSSEERSRERGFDVPESIFRSLADCENLEYGTGVLRRRKNTAPLFDMDVEERKTELQGCFALTGNVAGKRVLLCDDIYTTGSTLLEAAQVLLRGGAKSVGALCLCASRDNWEK